MERTRQRSESLRARRAQAIAQMPDLSEVIRGTLRRRYVRCGKPGCHCKRSRGHGPMAYLSVTEDGRTRQISVPPETYALAKLYVRNYAQLWRLVETISKTNRALLQERLLPAVSKRQAGPPRRKRTSRRPGAR